MLGAIEGTNGFTPERLMRRMDSVEAEIKHLKTEIDSTQENMAKSSNMLERIRNEHRQIISWADVFQDTSIEVQKMITSSMIKAVRISRDYEIDVEYNFDEGQYSMGLGM